MNICHQCGREYTGTACPALHSLQPKGTLADAIRQDAKCQYGEIFKAALQSAIQLIDVAEDKAEAKKLVQKLLDTYR